MVSFLCSLCGSTFSSEILLSRHMQRSHDSRIFNCETCNKELVGKMSLENHRKLHKTKNCKLCGEFFPYNSKVAHKSKCAKNKDLRLYTCEKCNFETNKKCNLGRHMSTHDQCAK